MSETEQLAELTVKDRLNFPYLLANQILTFQKSILALEFSEQEIRESVEGFTHMLPEAWKDDKFKQDLEQAKTTEKIDLRPRVAAGVKLSVEACKELGIKAIEEKEVIDYYKIFQACIDLLYRRKLLTKVHRVEVLEGVDFDTVAIPAVLEGDVSR